MAPWPTGDILPVQHETALLLGRLSICTGTYLKAAFPELSSCHGDRQNSGDSSDGRQDVSDAIIGYTTFSRLVSKPIKCLWLGTWKVGVERVPMVQMTAPPVTLVLSGGRLKFLWHIISHP